MSTETLQDAQEWLRGQVEEGATCPCCTQFAKVYRIKIHATMARELIVGYRAAGTEWFHLPTVIKPRGGWVCRLEYWGLLERDTSAVRTDGSKRIGWWRVTPTGAQYVQNELRVPKYARVYDNRCLGLDSEEMVGITDALGTKFNYRELMAGL